MTEVQESCPQGVAIRRLTPTDSGILAEVAAQMITAWGQSPSADEVGRRAARLTDELQSMDSAVDAMFGAWSAGKLIGSARVMQDKLDARSWCLYALAVHPEHRRRRIATALARTAINYAIQQGAESIQCQTHADNTASIEWHLSVGYVNKGIVAAPDGDKLVQFGMPLTPDPKGFRK